MMKANRGLVLVRVVVLVLLFGTRASLGAESDALKAAMIYRLATFVEWPEHAIGEGSFVIGVLGAPGVADALGALAAEQEIDGRPLEVRRFAGATQLGGCVLLFLGMERDRDVEEVLSQASGHSLLTMSDVRGFASRGGMIELVRHGKKLKFEVHRAAATEAGLRISSHLLELAEAVYPPAGSD